MDSFNIKRLLLHRGFKEYWHPGNYDPEKVKALGFSHHQYGVIYLKRDPKKPTTPQNSFPLVINGKYEDKLSTLDDSSTSLTWNMEKPAYYNTNLRGFPARVNPHSNGKKENPTPTQYGVALNVLSEEGLDALLNWLAVAESKKISLSEESYTGVNNDTKHNDEKVIREIKTRRGQPAFRNALLAVFDKTCCLTGCKVEAILEAAHIIAHSEETNYSVHNGLLLRADIHTLFDLDLVAIDHFGRVHIHSKLRGTEYEVFDKKVILCEISVELENNLKRRFENFSLN